MPCYSCFIWRLVAKPQTGKDFVSNPVSQHRDRGGKRVWKNSFSIKSNRVRCKPLNVPRKAGNKSGNGAWADSRNVHRPHGCAPTLWTCPDLFIIHWLWEEQAVNPEGWESRGMRIQSPPDPATNEKPTHFLQPWMCTSARAALKTSSDAIDILIVFSGTVITFHWTGEEAGRGCGCCWCIHISPLLPETA